MTSDAIAVIEKLEKGYYARFERFWNHSAEQVWAMLTDNDKLALWFAELRVSELRKGGSMTFDMGNGELMPMEIFELEPGTVLAFAWDDNVVRFELHQEAEGCRLLLVEQLTELNDHTPKDLAGWHVCLDVIEALLNGQSHDSRDSDWKQWYPRYIELLTPYREQGNVSL
ncbi:Uncharacterized conserved protein YndB, AHSA1/START domain [Paenibacillus algorifonticola]|uniref:Uncharacterized conserved protein YndB, AHSA1/START domain n=2 Tax=Paenibacillus algorifonticola TaxID=684063 RepID=A0A1I2DIS1_9BACL|nr:Uncharacterized conserved protein YndB, AHSA1/START domain [Paenibacillus algorifonticola]